MTDLEMTKLCAEAMGIDYIVQGEDVRLDRWRIYCPLHDDSAAMKLVKKFSLEISIDVVTSDDSTDGYVWIVDGGSYAEDENLNRAIVECVAKMQEQRATEK